MTRRSGGADAGEHLAPPTLCPRCAIRDQDASGFCRPCYFDTIAENYVVADLRLAEDRRRAWEERTLAAQRNLDVLYQQRSRLHRQTKPRSKAPPSTDPLLIAARALKLVGKLDPESRRELAESIRWLAHGPQADVETTA